MFRRCFCYCHLRSHWNPGLQLNFSGFSILMTAIQWFPMTLLLYPTSSFHKQFCNSVQKVSSLTAIDNFPLMILLFPIFFFFSLRDGVMGVSRSSENKRLTDGEWARGPGNSSAQESIEKNRSIAKVGPYDRCCS